MFYLLTKEQTNTSRLGCSCGHTALAVPHFRSITLLPSLKPSATSTQEHGSSWALRMPSTVCRVCNSLCSAALLTERRSRFLSSFVWGRGKEGERKPLSILFALSWAMSRGSQIWENVWTWDHGRLSPSTQHSNCRVLSEPQHQPLMLTSHVWESGQDRGTSTRLHSDAASSLPGTQWLGQPKKHTQGSGALKTSLPFSSKCFLLLTLLAYQWLQGKREKGRTRGKFNLPFPDMTQQCCSC